MVKHHLWKLIVAVVLAAILVTPGVSATPMVFQAPPPPNDNFADAALISGTDFYGGWVDVSAATTESGEFTSSCDRPIEHTIWYAFTAPAKGQITVNVTGDYAYTSNDPTIAMNAYVAPNGGLPSSNELINCTTWIPYPWGGGTSGLSIEAQAETTYYFQVATTQMMTDYQIVFNFQFVPAPPPPPNDNFADAKVIAGLPYDDNTDMTSASLEANEPTPSCGFTSKTIWYVYTPNASGSISQRTDTWSYTVVGVYTGSSLSALKELACRARYYPDGSYLNFHADAGTTYYFQVGTYENTWVPFHLEVTPPPVASFGYYPSDPSVFDNVSFYDNSTDPSGVGIQSQSWDFGDGSTATGWNPAHRYAADGDYTVKLTVITTDGRTASITQTVPVKTHDVAITKFSAPQSASAGQTRQLVVGLNSKRYVDEVEVQLFKSVPSGYQWVGTLSQTVPVRPSNRTTDFSFNYTFTKDDASIGKVTFKTVATIVNARDAWPADNEAIASPTKVGKK
jgi:PKD repeat protein